MKILVQRRDSLGDVCEVTPITHRLRRQYPHAEIDVDTQCVAVFKDSPDDIGLKRDVEYDLVYNLNMVFEKGMGRLHPVDAYSQVVFGDMKTPAQLRLAIGQRPALDVNWGRTIALHAARSWPNRTLPWAFWRELANLLVKRGWHVIATGTLQDWPMGGTGIIDMAHMLSLKDQLALLQACRGFICSQSGPMIFAQATDVPIICLNTIGPVSFINHDRHGVRGWGLTHVNAPVPCFGCYERLKAPTTYLECERGDNLCCSTFSPEKIVELADNL